MPDLGAVVTAITASLSECLCNEARLRDDGLCFCGILPGGDVVYDYCDRGGEVYVRLAGITPMLDEFNECVARYEVNIEVGVLRCPLYLDEDGAAPSEEEQAAAAIQQYADMSMMHKAIMCCDLGVDYPLRIGAYQPVGPAEGCLGGFWLATWTVD